MKDWPCRKRIISGRGMSHREDVDGEEDEEIELTLPHMEPAIPHVPEEPSAPVAPPIPGASPLAPPPVAVAPPPAAPATPAAPARPVASPIAASVEIKPVAPSVPPVVMVEAVRSAPLAARLLWPWHRQPEAGRATAACANLPAVRRPSRHCPSAPVKPVAPPVPPAVMVDPVRPAPISPAYHLRRSCCRSSRAAASGRGAATCRRDAATTCGGRAAACRRDAATTGGGRAATCLRDAATTGGGRAATCRRDAATTCGGGAATCSRDAATACGRGAAVCARNRIGDAGRCRTTFHAVPVEACATLSAPRRDLPFNRTYADRTAATVAVAPPPSAKPPVPAMPPAPPRPEPVPPPPPRLAPPPAVVLPMSRSPIRIEAPSLSSPSATRCRVSSACFERPRRAVHRRSICPPTRGRPCVWMASFRAWTASRCTRRTT